MSLYNILNSYKQLGEKVVVAGQKSGSVRYRGPTKFAPG